MHFFLLSEGVRAVIDRFRFAAATAAIFAALAGSASVAVAQTTLTHGYMLGDITPDSAKIWYRTSATAAVQIEYGTSSTLTGSKISDAHSPGPDTDYTAIQMLRWLTPSTTYYFNIQIDGVRQLSAPYPTFTTAPPRGTPLDFNFCVLADQAAIPYYPDQGCEVFGYLAAEQPKMVMQIGDFDHRLNATSPPRTVATFRDMWKELRSTATVAGNDWQTYLKSFPFYYVWDDHDFGWQWPEARKGPTYSLYTEQVLRAYRDMFPSPPLGNPDWGCWQSFEYGQCEFIMLDSRARRDRQDIVDDANKSMLDGDNRYNDQKTWLKNRLLNSKSTWKFLFCGITLNNSVQRMGTFFNYVTEKQELLDFIAEHDIRNVVWFSGDYHTAGAIDDGTNSGLPEVLVPHTNLNAIDDQFHDGESGGNRNVDEIKGDWSVGGLKRPTTPPYGAGFAIGRVMTNPPQVILETRGAEGLRLQLILPAQ